VPGFPSPHLRRKCRLSFHEPILSAVSRHRPAAAGRARGPFLGAGVNTRPPDASVWRRGAPFLPRGAELARDLALMNGFPSDDDHDRADLAKVASYGVESLGREWLRGSLRQVFDGEYEPCDIHTYLASLSTPLLIVTTNYDDLTERAFDRAQRPYDLVVHPTDNDEYAASVLWTKYEARENGPIPIKPNLLQVDLAKTTVIYKMHGTVYRHPPSADGSAWDSYVITEDDYLDFLSRMTGPDGGAVRLHPALPRSAVPLPRVRPE
jgi:hypothetical protein